MFQSSSGPKAGCNADVAGLTFTQVTFQSSSGPKAGCNVNKNITKLDRTQFQSSSGPKAGCNERHRRNQRALAVSILIRPEGRMQRSRRTEAWRPEQVSILIRPEGRMQRTDSFETFGPAGSFNPHPARRPDATMVTPTLYDASCLFQSSSGPKAGCNTMTG